MLGSMRQSWAPPAPRDWETGALSFPMTAFQRTGRQVLEEDPAGLWRYRRTSKGAEKGLSLQVFLIAV